MRVRVKKVGNTVVYSKVYTKKELAKLSPEDCKFVQQMSELADDCIKDRYDMVKQLEKGRSKSHESKRTIHRRQKKVP